MAEQRKQNICILQYFLREESNLREFLDLLLLKIEGRSINSSAINRAAVRTADLKIDYLKFYWFLLFAFI